MNALSNFVTAEREHYKAEDNNLFAFSLSQTIRYYEFIIMIYERHKEISQKMVSHQTKMMASISARNSGIMTEEQMQLFEEGNILMRKVELEIESFYIFAKIFLDMIARFILNYFSEAHKIKLNSHDKLTKNHIEYQTVKGLIFPDGFSESLTILKEHVGDFRDKQIAHLQNPRSIKGISYNTNGQTRISETHLYPKPTDSQVESRELSEVMSAIELYVQQVFAVIEVNRSKTRYAIKEQSGNLPAAG
jgi:hypothetical protein